MWQSECFLIFSTTVWYISTWVRAKKNNYLIQLCVSLDMLMGTIHLDDKIMNQCNWLQWNDKEQWFCMIRCDFVELRCWYAFSISILGQIENGNSNEKWLFAKVFIDILNIFLCLCVWRKKLLHGIQQQWLFVKCIEVDGYCASWGLLQLKIQQYKIICNNTSSICEQQTRNEYHHTSTR